MKKAFILIIILFLSNGCAFHYKNQKGIKVKGKDFQTRAGTVEKGKAHFWSELEIWFPWRIKADE
ncbi:hypothetical protein LCGC14_2859550 [marine sediment metagenome]|uniref:Uncharacterized protein n=1 Tax=marine sediment metagenome TaxID=412755 RepID=A0A0F9AX24_9ZZZZ